MRGLDVDVVVAAASPWSKRDDSSAGLDVPANVDGRRASTCSTCASSTPTPRSSSCRSQETDFQAGITTILEAMSMGKAVVVHAHRRPDRHHRRRRDRARTSRPAIAGALRAAIDALLADPAEAARLGAAGRGGSSRHADIEAYATRLAATIS